MRLDKLFSEHQLASRSECKKLVKAGRILINGKIASSPALSVDPEQDEICLDGEALLLNDYEYYMLNKPAGCVTATRDEHCQTVMEFLPERRHRNLAPVGRLDKDTEGLLLITNDGQLSHRLLAPKTHVEKEYLAVIDGTLTEKEIEQLEQGLDIGEKKPTAPAKIQPIEGMREKPGTALGKNRAGELEKSRKEAETALGSDGGGKPERNQEKAGTVLGNDGVEETEKNREKVEATSGSKALTISVSEILVTITEGKYHQIKRMFGVLGHQVLYLKRLRMGTLLLDETLAPGECRPLTKKEVEDLQKSPDMSPDTLQRSDGFV